MLIVDPRSERDACRPIREVRLDEALCLRVGPGSIGLGQYLAKAEAFEGCLESL